VGSTARYRAMEATDEERKRLSYERLKKFFESDKVKVELIQGSPPSPDRPTYAFQVSDRLAGIAAARMIRNHPAPPPLLRMRGRRTA
jgi:hypothetical protein